MNSYRPHLRVICEDEDLRDVAVGFKNASLGKAIDVERQAGGWPNLLEQLGGEYADMVRYPHRKLAVLFDGDLVHDRPRLFREMVPDNLLSRVLFIWVKDEVENLRAEMLQRRVLVPNRLEVVGELLAENCRSGARDHWSLDQLSHNLPELDRAIEFFREL